MNIYVLLGDYKTIMQIMLAVEVCSSNSQKNIFITVCSETHIKMVHTYFMIYFEMITCNVLCGKLAH